MEDVDFAVAEEVININGETVITNQFTKASVDGLNIDLTVI
jgi:hypothetical protein